MSVPLRWQESYEPEPSPLRLRPRRTARRAGNFRALVALAFCALLCGLTAGGVRYALALHTPSGLRLLPVTSSGGPLSLSGTSAERQLGYATIVGNVSNHGNAALSKIEAVVELLDSNGLPLHMESSLIAFDPLNAGESSPFRVELQDEPRAVSYRVRFKALLGPRLD